MSHSEHSETLLMHITGNSWWQQQCAALLCCAALLFASNLVKCAVCSGSPTSTGATFTCPTTTPTPPLKNCTGKCSTINGYIGNISATCRPVGTSTTGAWVINGACLKQCTGNPTQPANGTFNCVGIVAGQTCYATCKQGYVGAPSSLCQTSGLWSPVNSTCAPGCAGGTVSGQAFNGIFSCGTFTGWLKNCSGRCGEGFTGSLSAICQTDGTWATTGRCVPSNIGMYCVARAMPASESLPHFVQVSGHHSAPSGLYYSSIF